MVFNVSILYLWLESCRFEQDFEKSRLFFLCFGADTISEMKVLWFPSICLCNLWPRYGSYAHYDGLMAFDDECIKTLYWVSIVQWWEYCLVILLGLRCEGSGGSLVSVRNLIHNQMGANKRSIRLCSRYDRPKHIYDCALDMSSWSTDGGVQ
jgi:hypothetical protein